MTLGDRIKQKRTEAGLSVDELAYKLGKNRATVYRYENGEIENLPTTILEPIARVLNTTPAYLLGFEDNLENDTDMIAKMYKESELIYHVELLLKLDASDRKTIYQYAKFLAKEKGL